jgi:Ca2+-binding EF-hand superfamily protein
MNRDELLEMMQRNLRGKSKLLFGELKKTILDYQLHEHLKFLFRFTVIFKLVDQDGNGVLSEEEFKTLLLDKMQVIESKQEVNYLLKIVDPYNN